jgi:hypothetical protein
MLMKKRSFKNAKKQQDNSINITIDITIEDMDSLKQFKKNTEHKLKGVRQQIEMLQKQETQTADELEDLEMAIQSLEKN